MTANVADIKRQVGLALGGDRLKGYNNGMFGKFLASRKVFVSSVLMMALGAGSMAYGQDAPKRGRKYKAPPPTARIEVTVLRATTGKPIENAAVIFHPLVDGHDNGNMELKTNDEGKAVIDLLNIGSDVRLQIIAHGYQTYGEDYKVDKENMSIEVKMNRPVDQYSIYKKGEGKAAAGPDTTQGKPDAAPKDETPKDTPPGEATDKQQEKPNDAPKSDKPQDSAPPK